MMVSASTGRPDRPETAGEFAGVHHAIADEVRIFGVVDDQHVEIAGIGQRAGQHAGTGDRPRAVGEEHRAGLLQEADLGHFLAAQALGEGGGGMDVDDGGVAGAAEQDSRRSRHRRRPDWSRASRSTVVTPPAAAATLPEAMLSRCSSPGSPRKTRMSMRPGARTLPLQSMTVGAVRGGRSGSRRDRRSCHRRRGRRRASRSPPPDRPCEHSMRRSGRFIAGVVRQVAGEGFEHGHAHGDAHFDLFADERLRAVGDVRSRSRRPGSSGRDA